MNNKQDRRKEAEAGADPKTSSKARPGKEVPSETNTDNKTDSEMKAARHVNQLSAEEQTAQETGVDSPVEEKTADQVKAEYEETIKALEDRYLRLAAEFDNYKKRIARRFDELLKNSGENIILQILEVVDNFQRALEAASESSDFDSLRKGNELIYQHLFDILNKEGVKPIEAVGKEFNPGLHEAVMQVESDEYPEGVIVQEITRGYKLNDRVIRFAKVVVSKGKSGTEKASD